MQEHGIALYHVPGVNKNCFLPSDKKRGVSRDKFDSLLIVCELSRFRILYQVKQCLYGVEKVSTGIKKYILQQTEHSKPKLKIDANNDYAMVA